MSRTACQGRRSGSPAGVLAGAPACGVCGSRGTGSRDRGWFEKRRGSRGASHDSISGAPNATAIGFYWPEVPPAVKRRGIRPQTSQHKGPPTSTKHWGATPAPSRPITGSLLCWGRWRPLPPDSDGLCSTWFATIHTWPSSPHEVSVSVTPRFRWVQ